MKIGFIGAGNMGGALARAAAKSAAPENIYLADQLAEKQAIKEAIERGADPRGITTELERTLNTFEAEYGTVYIGYIAAATASGELGLNRI